MSSDRPPRPRFLSALMLTLGAAGLAVAVLSFMTACKSAGH